MWTDALASNQAYEVSKDRSERRNNTRRDAAALKEATDACFAAKMWGGLELVEEEKVVFESTSALVGVAKLKVYYLEALIRSKGQIPEKLPKAIQVD